MLLFSLSAP